MTTLSSSDKYPGLCCRSVSGCDSDVRHSEVAIAVDSPQVPQSGTPSLHRIRGVAHYDGFVMIRVIYRWRVEGDRHAEFVQWWHAGTLRIRSDHPGAMGSTLCSPTTSSDSVVAIARWQSQEDLERFWRSSDGSPFPGAEMESIEILDEVDHLTQED